VNKEPATIIAAVTALVTAILGLLVAYGVPISEDQRNAILGTLAATCTVILVMGPVIRQYVWSPNSVEKKVTEAYEATPGVDPKPMV